MLRFQLVYVFLLLFIIPLTQFLLKKLACRVLVGIVRMLLWTSKGEIRKWKLTEDEEPFFGKDYSVRCIHNMGCENEGTPTIF